MSKKVVITGGTGFIGRNVVNELVKRGYEVHSLVYPPFAPKQDGLFQYEMNLMDSLAVNEFFKTHKFENLVHLAWYVGKGCQTSDVNFDWLSSSLNLLRAFCLSGGKKVLCAGSVSEYDYSYGFMNEDKTPLNNEFLYGKTKAALYSLADAYCKSKNVDFKWARIFNVYGPNEKPERLMPSVICSMLKGEDVRVSTCEKFQDYLHVEDMACAITEFFESEVTGAVNMCSGKPIQLRSVVEKIAQLVNYDGNILWGAVPVYFEEKLIVGDNTKLKDLVKFVPKYSIDEGLKQTISWWKDNLNV